MSVEERVRVRARDAECGSACTGCVRRGEERVRVSVLSDIPCPVLSSPTALVEELLGRLPSIPSTYFALLL